MAGKGLGDVSAELIFYNFFGVDIFRCDQRVAFHHHDRANQLQVKALCMRKARDLRVGLLGLREQIIDGFMRHFESRYDTTRSEYSPEDLAAARELVDSKFSTHEWTHRIP